MKKTNELAYLAGFFDGEGSIRIDKDRKRRYYRLEVRVATAGEYIPRLYHFHFGGSVRCRRYRIDKPHWYFYYNWSIVAVQALAFLEAIMPYLKLKRPQAELGIAFQKRKMEQGNPCRKGVSDEEKAVREAEFILMHNMKKETYK